MPYIYTSQNKTFTGDLSIIPNKYHEWALEHRINTIKAHQFKWLCPPLVVGISECIMYELDEDELNKN